MAIEVPRMNRFLEDKRVEVEKESVKCHPSEKSE